MPEFFKSTIYTYHKKKKKKIFKFKTEVFPALCHFYHLVSPIHPLLVQLSFKHLDRCQMNDQRRLRGVTVATFLVS